MSSEIFLCFSLNTSLLTTHWQSIGNALGMDRQSIGNPAWAVWSFWKYIKGVLG